MRLLGNFGTIRVGAPFGVEFYWNRQWTIKCKAASATLTKTVRLTDEDLSAFYVKGGYESGSLVLNMSQGCMTKELVISTNYKKRVDMGGFDAGLIKLVLSAKSVKNMKLLIGWRR